MDVKDYNKWIDYPPGVYKPEDIFGPPHPGNTNLYKSDGHSVLVSINYSTDRPKGTAWDDRKIVHTGWCVTVWTPEPGSLISASRVVRSLGEIDAVVEELKAEVMTMCRHKDSTELRSRWQHEHRFKCNDCGEVWGYDSSG